MNITSAKAFLKVLGCKVPESQPRTGFAISDCPLGPWRHENGKSSPKVFGLRLSDGHCKCFSCDWSGSAEDLVHDLYSRTKTPLFAKAVKAPNAAIDFKAAVNFLSEFESDEPPWQTLDQKLGHAKNAISIFPEEWLNSFPPVHNVGWAVEYLKTRMVSGKTAAQLGLRADTKQRRICFPIRDFKNQLVGLHGRAVDENVEPRYRMYLCDGKNNQIVWYGESWVKFYDPIVVVEGPFDLTSVLRVYGNVVSPLFANPSFEKINRMSVVKQWVTFLDRGKGGDCGREKIEKALAGTHEVYHVMPPEGVKDPGKMSAQEVYDVLTKVLPQHALHID